MEYPTVSVIVLNYNGLRYMEDCFVSLGRLEYPAGRVELVLADNASTDGSVEYVQERFPHVRVMRFDRNYGFCGGNNRAAAGSQAGFVAFLNSDMRVEPGWLTGLVEALDDEPDVVCSASKVLTWDGTAIDFGGLVLSFLGHCRAAGYHDPDLEAYDHVRYILGPIGGAMLIDRQVFLEAGGFDEDFFAYFDDADLGWRLWILGYKVVFAPQSICYHVHYGSTSEQPRAKMQYLYERNALYTIVKNYEQRYLERVLPLALLLQAKRAYLLGEMGGTDMDRCRLGVETSEQAGAPVTRYDTGYYLREAWRTLRAEGLSPLVRKTQDELKRRRDIVAMQALAGVVASGLQQQRWVQRPPLFWVQQANLTAASDAIDGWGGLLEKRAAIQQRRRRTDREIFQTVRALSFDVCFDTPEYRRTQRRLIELFGIKELFGDVFDPDIPFALLGRGNAGLKSRR